MKFTNYNSVYAAIHDRLPAMELLLNSARKLRMQISDEYLGQALYQMYCG